VARWGLRIDPAVGMAGDMLLGALIGLGVPERGMVAAMRPASEVLDVLDVHSHLEFLEDGAPARRLHVIVAKDRQPLAISDAPAYLGRILEQAGVAGAYADFARRALDILCEAERSAHSGSATVISPSQGVMLPVVGRAHTPYYQEAPYQPSVEEDVPDDAFYIELDPKYAEGLMSVESFTHLFIISYLDRSRGYSMVITPPWRDRQEQHGLFATRSPNRPSPIGLTRTRLRRVEGNRLYTGPLDLFDGTPVLDIKPFIRSLDGPGAVEVAGGEAGNDGWLEGSEHLELHRRGIPHTHPGESHLHEAQNILLYAIGTAWGLQWLDVDLNAATCLSPVHVGGGVTGTTSHGRMPVPSPATGAILERYGVPYALGPVQGELLTPSGAALLAALSPTYVARGEELVREMRVGIGLGHLVLDRPNALRVCIEESPVPARR